MSEIKVFKTTEAAISHAGTEAEIREKYSKWKLQTQLPPFVFDAFVKMELEPHVPPEVAESSIISVQVKNLLSYCVPLFDTNPNIPSAGTKGVWLQTDRDITGIDLSFKEYKIPMGQKFRVVGLQLKYRLGNGVPIFENPTYTNVLQECSAEQLFESGSWSILHPRKFYMGALLTPFPTKIKDQRFLIEKQSVESMKFIIDDISHINLWYEMNYSLLFDAVPFKSVRPPPVKFPVVKATASTFAKRIDKFVIVQFSEKTIIYDLAQIDLLDMYHKFKITGSDLQSDDSILGFGKVEDQYSTFRTLQEQKYKRQTLLFSDALKNYIAFEMFDREYATLRAADRKLVDTKYEKTVSKHAVRSKEADAIFKKVRRLLESTGGADKRPLRELLKELSGRFDLKSYRTAKAVLPLKGTREAVLCPHFVDIIEQYIAAPINEFGAIDTQTVVENIVHRWAEKIPVNYRYYCSVCGELLMIDDLEDVNMFNQTIISGTSDKDPLWFYILAEVTQALRFVKFSKPRKLDKLRLAIAQTMESEMNAKQSELEKSKTKSSEEIKYTMILTASIYCFALLSKMMIDQPTMSWNVAIGGAAKKGSAQQLASKVLSTAFYLIAESKNTMLSKITDFSTENIKPLLLKAYEWARNTKFAKIEEEGEEISAETIMLHELELDPFYNFAKVVATINSGNVFSGDSLKNILCQELPFINIYDYKKEPTTHLLKCYKAIREYYNSPELHREFVVPTSPILTDWWKKWKVLAEEDERAEMRLKTLRLQPWSQMYDLELDMVPRFPILDIATIRCPSGEKHIFDVYKFSKSKTVSYQDFIKIDISERGRLGEVTDRLCSRCGQSAAAKKTNVASHVKELNEMENFYKWFENRCPKSELHEYKIDKDGFVGDSPCKKCGYQRSFFVTRPAKYYKTYRSSMPKKDTIMIPLKRDTKTYELKKFGKWSVTLASVLSIANMSNTSYNIWVNLGLSEHRNFEMIRTSKINPQSTISDTESQARLVKLVNYVSIISKTYYLIKNHAKVSIPANLKPLLEDEPIGKAADAHMTLNKSMPDIFTDFYARLEYYKFTHPIKLTVNYVLHTICITLLQIRGLTAIKKLAHRIFEFLVTQIINGELLMSELEIQKIVTVAKEEELDVDDDTYLEMGEQQDLLDKGTEDPFSLDEADIETTNVGLDDEEFMD